MALPIRAPAEDNEVVNEAMKSTSDIKVFRKRRLRIGRSQFIGFEPKKNPRGVGFIVYPGTFVDAAAYAPLAKRVAEHGYHAAIATPPFSLSSLGEIGRDYGDKIIDYRGWKDVVKTWAISGHSQGGAIACSYANKNQDSKLKAVILMAAYGGDADAKVFSGDLSETDFDVLSLYGSLDGIALYEDVKVEGEKKLPPNAAFFEIEGGNHSQFSYAEGIQQSGDKVDGTPTITLEAQQEIVFTKIVELLKKY